MPGVSWLAPDREGGLVMETVFGIEIPDLPDGVTPIEAVGLVKFMHDGDGSMGLAERKSASLPLWEAMGMTITAADTMRAHLVGLHQVFQDGDDDDE